MEKGKKMQSISPKIKAISLFEAINNREVKTLRRLLDEGVDVNSKNEDGVPSIEEHR